jgi:WD40 repeat protein
MSRALCLLAAALAGCAQLPIMPGWNNEPSAACCLAFSPDGKTLAVGEAKNVVEGHLLGKSRYSHSSGRVRFLDTASLEQLAESPLDCEVNRIALSPSGDLLISGTWSWSMWEEVPQQTELSVLLWGWQCGMVPPIGNWHPINYWLRAGQKEPEREQGVEYEREVVSGDGRALLGLPPVCRSRWQSEEDEKREKQQAGTVEIRPLNPSARSGKKARLAEKTPSVVALASENGPVAFVDQQGFLFIHPLQVGQVPYSLPAQEGTISHLHFTPDGKRLISATKGSSREPAIVVVWDIARRSVEERLICPSGPVEWLRLSPNGRHLAVGIQAPHAEADLILWDTINGSRHYLLTHRQPKATPAFSPDGRRLAVITATGKVEMIDLPER